MTTWVLYLALANGVSERIEIDPAMCRYIPVAIEAGHPIHADYYGRRIEITRAACHGPASVDPCDMGAGS